MRKLEHNERVALMMIEAVGGSYCPTSISSLHPSRTKILRRLVNKGYLSAEETDLGFQLTDQWHNGEA